MNGLVLLTILGVFFKAGISLYVKKDGRVPDIFNRQNFNDKSPLVILGVWPAGAFGIGDQTANQEEAVPVEAEEPKLVIDYYPTSLTDDDSSPNDDENAANNEGSQKEDQANSDTLLSDTTMEENIPQIIIDSWPQDLVDSIDDENRTRELENLAENNRRKRSTSCGTSAVLKIKAYYDNAFKARFGSEAEDKIRGIFQHMQVMMQFESIAIRVNGENVNGMVIDSFTLVLEGITYLAGQTIPATSNGLQKFGTFVEGSFETANNYMLFSSQDDQAGVVGIAYKGTTCINNLKYRTSLVEYYMSAVTTAQIAVHELGHSLGAEHDFLGGNIPRFDSKGRTCTGINAVMDYGAIANKWSNCSNEDIGTYFSGLDVPCFETRDSCAAATPTCSCLRYRGKRKQICCSRQAKGGACCDGCPCMS